ncbi:nucleotide pyrophosphohydrolase [Ideonella livida]|uniref:Nucleotide pyrophosphohydrolase n=1 Tax=Ideonella livida TaxID=2707176 RepID=A0A7C9TIS2_9BURK|nr:nucleotide pyrophosphohydrolase [Ideonella livida]NDY91278.1 nucleotide pyrophosphohydrolase [Ideonella livida]
MSVVSPEVLAAILRFREERDWRQFHNARHQAAALAIEAGELQEQFLWLRDDELAARWTERREDIEDEVADVATMLALFCHDHGIDLDAAVQRKLVKAAAKYPVEQARGRHLKYDRLVGRQED